MSVAENMQNKLHKLIARCPHGCCVLPGCVQRMHYAKFFNINTANTRVFVRGGPNGPRAGRAAQGKEAKHGAKRSMGAERSEAGEGR